MDLWARDRAAFTHDAMKNGLLRSLAALEKMCGGEVLRPDLGAELSSIVDGWRGLEMVVSGLIGRYEAEMSPAGLLNEEPFSRLDAVDRIMLSDLVELTWRSRYDIDGKIAEAKQRVQAVNGAVEHFRCLLHEGPNEQSKLAECGKAVREIHDAGRRLVECLSGLPVHRVP